MNARMYKLGKFALTVGCCVHITGCIWYFCAKLEYFDPSGWVADGGYIDSTDSTKYIAAIYWSF